MLSKTQGRWLLFSLFISGLLAFFLLGGQEYLRLDYIQSQQKQLLQLQSTHPLWVACLYFLVYVISTAFSLPGAAILTLLGGALFGLFWGTVIVSFASSLGATLAFFMARFVLRDSVEKKFSKSLKKINSGIESEGAFYLFSLRLIPLVPFFVLNLVMGLTKMRASVFYLVSQVGMLPGTLVFVNAGQELGRIESLGDILSFRLWLSFAILGLFPIVIKKLMQFFCGQRGGINHGSL